MKPIIIACICLLSVLACKDDNAPIDQGAMNPGYGSPFSPGPNGYTAPPTTGTPVVPGGVNPSAPPPAGGTDDPAPVDPTDDGSTDATDDKPVVPKDDKPADPPKNDPPPPQDDEEEQTIYLNEADDQGYGVCNQSSGITTGPGAWGPYKLACRKDKAGCLTDKGNQSSIQEQFAGFNDPDTKEFLDALGCTNGGHCCNLQVLCPDGGFKGGFIPSMCTPILNAMKLLE